MLLKFLAHWSCNLGDALHLGQYLSLVVARAQQPLDLDAHELLELSVVEDAGKLAEAARSPLGHASVCRNKLIAYLLHQFFLVNQIIVFLQKRSKFLENLSEYFKTFFLHLIFTKFDPFKQFRINSTNHVGSFLLPKLLDSASDRQRVNISYLLLAGINHHIGELLNNHNQVLLCNDCGSLLNAFNGIWLHIQALIIQMLDESGADPPLHGLFDLLCLRHFSHLRTEIHGSHKSCILIIILAFFQELHNIHIRLLRRLLHWWLRLH